MGVGGQWHAPAALLPANTRYLLYRRLGGSQSRSGRAQKILLPPGFDPRTVQPVASCYTDRAITAPDYIYIHIYMYICIYKRIRHRRQLILTPFSRNMKFHSPHIFPPHSTSKISPATAITIAMHHPLPTVVT